MSILRFKGFFIFLQKSTISIRDDYFSIYGQRTKPKVLIGENRLFTIISYFQNPFDYTKFSLDDIYKFRIFEKRIFEGPRKNNFLKSYRQFRKTKSID